MELFNAVLLGSTDANQVIVTQTRLTNLSIIDLTEVDMSPKTMVVNQFVLVLALSTLLVIEIVGVGLAKANNWLFTKSIYVHIAVLTSGTLFGANVD